MLQTPEPFREADLPNILIYIDVREGRPTAPTLFAIGETRRVARLAGASVFGVVLTPPLGTEALDVLARPIAEAGADKLLLCEGSDFAGVPCDLTHGRGLDAATGRVPPLLVLFPAGGAGAALGPPLAARLGGPFAPWCDFLTSDGDRDRAPDSGGGRVQLIRVRAEGRSRRRLDPLEIERPVVATLGAGRPGPATGRIQDLEIDVVSCVPLGDDRGLVMTERLPDPHAHLPLAPVLVLIGDGDDGRPVCPPDLLRSGLSDGVVVERARDVPAAVLAACCPDILLKVGPSLARTGRSPRTRVILAAVSATLSDPVVDDVDVLWQFSGDVPLSPATIAALLNELGGGA